MCTHINTHRSTQSRKCTHTLTFSTHRDVGNATRIQTHMERKSSQQVATLPSAPGTPWRRRKIRSQERKRRQAHFLVTLPLRAAAGPHSWTKGCPHLGPCQRITNASGGGPGPGGVSVSPEITGRKGSVSQQRHLLEVTASAWGSAGHSSTWTPGGRRAGMRRQAFPRLTEASALQLRAASGRCRGGMCLLCRHEAPKAHRGRRQRKSCIPYGEWVLPAANGGDRPGPHGAARGRQTGIRTTLPPSCS